jgi:hypothetical protein
MSQMSPTPGTPATARRTYHTPALLRLGNLARATLAGTGTNWENVSNCMMGTASMAKQKSC